MAWDFGQPGSVNDFQGASKWHAYMAERARVIIRELVAEILGHAPSEEEIEAWRDRLGYVDPTVTPPPADAETLNIQNWGGFPLTVERTDWSDITDTEFDPVDPDGRFRAVEMLGDEDFRPGVFVDRFNRQLSLPVRHRQDEYLEWAVAPDARSIAFVTEGYDYYQTLFQHDEAKVVEIYRTFTGIETLTADDLRAPDGIYRLYDAGGTETVARPGGYNPRNRFNINPGIVHLTHRANSLGAEVTLAGTSALLRTRADGTVLDGNDRTELICCNRGGAPNRNSDPVISQAGYGLVRDGYRYTLANPIGLYVAGVNFGGVLLPNNADPVPREWWHEVRGAGLSDPTTSRVLRLELKIPEGETIGGRPMTLGDLMMGGANVHYPGQFATLIDVHLFVTRWQAAQGDPVTAGCMGTCCRVTGSPLVRPTTGGCAPGADLFPGLLTAPLRGATVTRGIAVPHRVDPYDAVVSRI